MLLGTFIFWVAAITLEIFSGTSRCGGSLVNEWYVVTAGHCVARARASQVRITLGEYVLKSDVEPLPGKVTFKNAVTSIICQRIGAVIFISPKVLKDKFLRLKYQIVGLTKYNFNICQKSHFKQVK